VHAVPPSNVRSLSGANVCSVGATKSVASRGGPSLPVSHDIAKLYWQMKSTFDINDALLARAKRHARKAGKPLRALIEEGLRRVLDESASPATYVLPDRAVGEPTAENPLEKLSWQDLRDEIYGGR